MPVEASIEVKIRDTNKYMSMCFEYSFGCILLEITYGT